MRVKALAATRAPDDVHLFKPLPGFGIGGIAVGGFLILIWPALWLLMSFDTPEMLFQPVTLVMHVIVIPLMFLLGLMIYFSFTGMRLIIAPDRIEFYTVGYSIVSDWNNVARVGPMPGAIAGIGIYLREPRTKLGGWMDTFFALQPLFAVLARASGRSYSSRGQEAAYVIPLGAFVADWKHSEIGKLLRRYAPQVFDATQTPGPSPAEVNALYEDVAKKSEPKPWPIIAAFAGGSALLWICVLFVAHGQTPDLNTTLKGHTDCIRSLAFAPDGNLLVSASDDKTVRLWDVAAKKEKWILRGDTLRLRRASFSPDGAVLAGSDYEQFVKIWDVASGKEMTTLNGPDDPINSIAFSPDGKLLATCGRHVIDPSKSDPEVLLWDATHLTNGGKPLAQLATRLSAVGDPAFSPDSKQLAVGDTKGTVEIWDVTEQQLKTTVANDGEYDSIDSLLYSPDGRTFARLNIGAQIYLYETAGYQLTKKINTFRASSIAFSPDGKLLAVGCEDHKVRMVVVATLETVATFPGHNAEVGAVAFSADGKTLASADGPVSSGGAFRIYLWDTNRLTAGKTEAR